MAAGLGFTTFATGDVLTAASVNGYLMQGVWVFADATARDAAVTSPQEGNMCYLKNTDSVQYYSGSAWTAVGGTTSSPGMVYVGGSTFSSSSAVNLNNIFTSTYANYKVFFNCTGSTGGVMQIRFRVSGSDNSTTNYEWQRLSVYGTTAAPERQQNQTYFLPCTINTTQSGAEILVTNPQTANKKLFLGHAIQEAGQGTDQMFLTTGSFDATTQFDGMSLFPSSGTITGNIRVYGLANS